MIKKIFLVLLSIILVLALVIQFQPVDFTITRSALMNASAERIFPEINNLHNWNAWSPWAKLDPQATNSFSGPQEGTGSVMSWSGNDQVGEGSMTITESKPSSLIVFRLDFLRPFESSAEAQFTLEEGDKGTLVSWAMHGKNNFIGKAISLFMDCDAMVGAQFEEGLASLEEIVEKPLQAS